MVIVSDLTVIVFCLSEFCPKPVTEIEKSITNRNVCNKIAIIFDLNLCNKIIKAKVIREYMPKIISYNVNGIRAALKKDWIAWLKAVDADVVCLQEVKATIDQVDLTEIKELGYHIEWNAAEKRGYSGTATFSKVKPKSVTKHIRFETLDREGRFLLTEFNDFSVLNVYLPSGSNKEERQLLKIEFLAFFDQYIQNVLKNSPKLVICGDFNICRLDIDIHNPKMNIRTPGWTPLERNWFNNFLENNKLIDTFRYFNNEPHQYTWWSYMARARVKNLGWRIDYQLISKALENNLSRAVILSNAKHSDHCPVLIELK